jgi:hypothetical protein
MEKVESGLTKVQAEEILDLMSQVREKYTKNNESMLIIQEQLNRVLDKRGLLEPEELAKS